MSSHQPTHALLTEAATFVASEAERIKEACDLRGGEWACQGCDAATCGGRKEHATALDLAARLKARAEALRRPDPLDEALNSGDGSYRP